MLSDMSRKLFCTIALSSMPASRDPRDFEVTPFFNLRVFFIRSILFKNILIDAGCECRAQTKNWNYLRYNISWASNCGSCYYSLNILLPQKCIANCFSNNIHFLKKCALPTDCRCPFYSPRKTMQMYLNVLKV